MTFCLTHLSLASFLWDIGKQHSPRWDAAERGIPSGAVLFAQRNFIEFIKIAPSAPKNESGLTQLIMMGKSIRQLWVNMVFHIFFPQSVFWTWCTPKPAPTLTISAFTTNSTVALATAVAHTTINTVARSYIKMSRLVGKPTMCIGENKDADQLRGNREADQHLCFRHMDSTIPFLLISKVSSF